MSSQADQPSLVLTRRLADGTVEWVPLEIPQHVPAAPGAAYALIDRADYEAPQRLVAQRQGEDLVVEVAGTEVLVLDGFFATEDVAFHPTTDIASGAGPFSGSPLTPDSLVLAGSPEGEQVVWAAEGVQVARSAEPGEGGEHGDDGGGSSPLLWGGLALGGLGLAAAAGGGGGGSGGGDGGGGNVPPPPVERTVEGSVVGGPVINGNGLSVQVFEANGTTQLGEAKVAADGSFSIDVGSYSGVVIARVVDADTGEDYLDEASEANKDLNAVLSAARDNSGTNTTVFVNINPLTTLAAALAAREAGGGAPTADQVARSNAAVAELFGLSDLHAITVVSINGGAYDAGDGFSAEERYGVFLAAFSGADLNNGGDSQQTIDDVLAGLTLSGGAASLNESAQAVLVQGAQTVESETGESLSDIVSSAVDTFAPRITSGDTATEIPENSGAGQVVYTAIADDAGALTWSLEAGGDAAAFTIDAGSGEVTLTNNPDFETKSSYSFTVVATDAAGNSSEQAVSLSISDQDDSAPFITSGATATPIDENSSPGQVVYTAAATDDGTVTWGLKASGDAAAFGIDADTGAVTLTGSPDHETKSSYSFTVVATDDEGNSSEQAVTLVINDLDEVAPTITSGSTAAAIDENSGAGQVVYTVTSTDTGDISTGSTTYSLKSGGDAAAFSIDAGTGAVTLTGNPNHEAKSSYGFTVVATDAAGNSSERAVSLAINDLDEVPPTITSSAIATAIDENSGGTQVVYTVTSTDTGDISTGSTTYSLKPVNDATAFSINASTGAVTLIGNPDHETKSSYGFTVVATDAAGNSSERAVTLAIKDLDEVPPTITSGTAAPAINENSGAGQVVYTVTSTDTGDISTGSTTYSLKPVDDSAAFSIDASTGEVTLTSNPDFETKPSYNFTVVATDAAENSSEKAVTLAINDIADETAPTVSSVALTSAVGAQNNSLNAGDTVRVTVTMSENTTVDTSGGTPRIALTIGSGTAHADYVSGSGTTSLLFDYTVQPGDTDSDGISIPANGLEANGGSLTDATGNAAVLIHASVANNALFAVDTTAPTLSSSTPADNANDVPVDGNIVLIFSEDVLTGSGNITISDGDADTRSIAITDASQVSVSGNQVTINPGSDLNGDRTYTVQIGSGALTDEAGNAYAGISDTTTLNFDTESLADPTIVVFDLVQGSSSDHSGRTFQTGVSYDIYIRVDSDAATLSTAGGGPGTWDTWGGAANLGSDDRIILVGDGAAVQGAVGPVNQVFVSATTVAWQSSLGVTAGSLQGRSFARATGGPRTTAILFDTSLPGVFLGNQGGQLNTMHFTNMPAGILTSQGLV